MRSVGTSQMNSINHQDGVYNAVLINIVIYFTYLICRMSAGCVTLSVFHIGFVATHIRETKKSRFRPLCISHRESNIAKFYASRRFEWNLISGKELPPARTLVADSRVRIETRCADEPTTERTCV